MTMSNTFCPPPPTWRLCHPVNIYVYQNGVEHFKPCLVHIAMEKKKNMNTVLEEIGARMKLAVGYPIALYNMDGSRVCKTYELEMYNNYVVVTNLEKRFKCVDYGNVKDPLVVIGRCSKHVNTLKLHNKKFDLFCRAKIRRKPLHLLMARSGDSDGHGPDQLPVQGSQNCGSLCTTKVAPSRDIPTQCCSDEIMCVEGETMEQDPCERDRDIERRSCMLDQTRPVNAPPSTQLSDADYQLIEELQRKVKQQDGSGIDHGDKGFDTGQCGTEEVGPLGVNQNLVDLMIRYNDVGSNIFKHFQDKINMDLEEGQAKETMSAKWRIPGENVASLATEQRLKEEIIRLAEATCPGPSPIPSRSPTPSPSRAKLTNGQRKMNSVACGRSRTDMIVKQEHIRNVQVDEMDRMVEELLEKAVNDKRWKRENKHVNREAVRYEPGHKTREHNALELLKELPSEEDYSPRSSRAKLTNGQRKMNSVACGRSRTDMTVEQERNRNVQVDEMDRMVEELEKAVNDKRWKRKNNHVIRKAMRYEPSYERREHALEPLKELPSEEENPPSPRSNHAKQINGRKMINVACGRSLTEIVAEEEHIRNAQVNEMDRIVEELEKAANDKRWKRKSNLVHREAMCYEPSYERREHALEPLKELPSEEEKPVGMYEGYQESIKSIDKIMPPTEVIPDYDQSDNDDEEIEMYHIKRREDRRLMRKRKENYLHPCYIYPQDEKNNEEDKYPFSYLPSDRGEPNDQQIRLNFNNQQQQQQQGQQRLYSQSYPYLSQQQDQRQPFLVQTSSTTPTTLPLLTRHSTQVAPAMFTRFITSNGTTVRPLQIIRPQQQVNGTAPVSGLVFNNMLTTSSSPLIRQAMILTTTQSPQADRSKFFPASLPPLQSQNTSMRLIRLVASTPTPQQQQRGVFQNKLVQLSPTLFPNVQTRFIRSQLHQQIPQSPQQFIFK